MWWWLIQSCQGTATMIITGHYDQQEQGWAPALTGKISGNTNEDQASPEDRNSRCSARRSSEPDVWFQT